MNNTQCTGQTHCRAVGLNSVSVEYLKRPYIKVRKQSSTIALLLASSCFLAACGGGSGDTDMDVGTEIANPSVDPDNTGTPDPTVLSDSDNSDIETDNDSTDSADPDDTETGEQNNGQSVDQDNVDSASEEDVQQSAENENITDDSDSGEDNPDGDNTEAEPGVTVIQPVVWNEMAVTGTTSGTALEIKNLNITKSGSMVFTSRVKPANQNIFNLQEHILAGKVGNPPQVVIGTGDEINADRAGFELSFPRQVDIASDGTVALIASVRRDSPGSFSGSESSEALIIVRDGVTETPVMLNDKIDSPRGEVELIALGRVSVSAAGVVFTGRTRGAGSPFGLFVEQENGFKSLVEDGNGASAEVAISIDGCRVKLSIPRQFRVLDDGALVFSAIIDGGFVGSACTRSGAAILHYKDGKLDVIAREGNPLEGNENYEFGKPSLVEILDDGRVIVSTTIVDKAGSFASADWTSRHTIWMMSKDASPVLMVLEGETITRSTGESVMDFGNVDTGVNTQYEALYSADTSGQIAMRVYERGFSPLIERVSIHRTNISSLAQKPVEINNPGDTGYQLLDEAYANQDLTGSQLTSGLDNTELLPPFTDTERLLSINNFTIDNAGNVYFHAVVMDSVTFDQQGNYIFRRDANGRLSVIAGPLDRVEVEGRDELIFSSFLGNRFGSFSGDDGLQLTAIPGNKLVVNTENAVLSFDQN